MRGDDWLRCGMMQRGKGCRQNIEGVVRVRDEVRGIQRINVLLEKKGFASWVDIVYSVALEPNDVDKIKKSRRCTRAVG